MLQQLKFITDDSDPYFNFYFRLLESLSTVKSVVLVFELPDGLELMTEFFQLAFTHLASSSVNETCRMYTLELLQTLVEECDVLPSGVIELMWSHFERESNPNNNALRLASELLRMTHQRFGPFFGSKVEQVYQSSHARRDVHKAEVAVKNILAASLEAAASILMVIGTRLNLDDDEAKSHAIKFLGSLFADHFSRNRDILMPEMLGLVWNNWLSRKHDKNVDIRSVWISTLGSMLQKTPSIILLSEILTGLNEKLLDPDGKVRENAVMVLSGCDPMTLPDALLLKVVNRARDKSSSVRTKALECIKRMASAILASGCSQGKAILSFHQ